MIALVHLALIPLFLSLPAIPTKNEVKPASSAAVAPEVEEPAPAAAALAATTSRRGSSLLTPADLHVRPAPSPPRRARFLY